MEFKLYEAVTGDDVDALKKMDKSLEVGDQLTPTNSTVLHLACQYGSTNCVKEILRVHASLLLKINSRGETALHLAASQGHYDVVVALIDAAKSSRLQSNNLTADTSLTVVQILTRATTLELETALHAAVRYKRQDVVQLLVKEDPSHSHPKNKYEETPLYLACIKCEYGIIDTILENCTSPTFGGPDGRTALHAAAMNHAGFECMKLLLEKMKGLIKIVDNHGWTAYHYVAYNEICEIVENLVRADKSVGYRAEKEYERTALHIAAHKGNRRVLMELARYYPDCCEAVDMNGKNLLHIAVFVRKTHANAVVSRASLNFWPMLERKHIDKERVQSKKEWEYLKGKKVEVAIIKQYRTVINTHMIVAALITTVALTAGFTMPGGFDQNHGSAILIKRPAFKTFIATDSIALLSSISSLFLYFVATWHKDANKVQLLIIVSSLLNIFSIIAMMIAFITGTYAALEGSPGIAISVCVISTVFFLLVIYILFREFGKFLDILRSNSFFQPYFTKTNSKYKV